jgi:cytochrome c oxidase subunit IV
MESMEQDVIVQRVADQHRHHGKSQFFYVWGALLVMTAIEVYLGYQNMEPVKMLTILMGLSVVKAGLIIAYFMHMKFEASAMKWLTMCSLVFCLCMMMVFFPDAFRILHLGVR